jgi:phosphatidylglycerophosphate synthase
LKLSFAQTASFRNRIDPIRHFGYYFYKAFLKRVHIEDIQKSFLYKMKNKTALFCRMPKRASRYHDWVPNSVTLLRLVLVLPFLIFIHDIIVYNCTNLFSLVLFIAIIISDVLDGFLARRLNCASHIGAKLDIFSDTVYAISSLFLFVYFKIIPLWFPFVTAVKLIEFIITSKLLKNKYKTNRDIIFDKTGKTAINMVMLMPGLFVFRCIITNYRVVMNIAVYIVTVMFAVSFLGRIMRLARPVKITGASRRTE